MMKILFYVDGIAPGGKERRLIELMRQLRHVPGLEVELAVMSREFKYPQVLDLGIPIHYIPRRTKKDPLVFWNLYKVCQQVRPTIIHAWDSMTAVYAAPVAKALGITFVNGMITNASFKLATHGNLRWRSWFSFLFADAIVSNSLAGLEAYHPPPAKSICIHNGFDMRRVASLTEPGLVRSALAIHSRHVVGMIGEFADRKDYWTFLRAAEQILHERDDVTFLAIGDGANLEKCKQSVSVEAEDHIKFPGWQDDVESIISIMDVGVLASNNDVHGEGISNAILEYMALGKPVVATECSGTREIVVDEVTGFLVPSKDRDSLAKRVMFLLDNEECAHGMGEKGRARVAESFSMEAMLSCYVELYAKLAAGAWRV
jgi:glycosyltransferase involved in cell wall biosynthesis